MSNFETLCERHRAIAGISPEYFGGRVAKYFGARDGTAATAISRAYLSFIKDVFHVFIGFRVAGTVYDGNDNSHELDVAPLRSIPEGAVIFHVKDTSPYRQAASRVWGDFLRAYMRTITTSDNRGEPSTSTYPAFPVTRDPTGTRPGYCGRTYQIHAYINLSMLWDVLVEENGLQHLGMSGEVSPSFTRHLHANYPEFSWFDRSDYTTLNRCWLSEGRYRLRYAMDENREISYDEDKITQVIERARLVTEEVPFTIRDLVSPGSYPNISKAISDQSFRVYCVYLTSIRDAVHNSINNGEAEHPEYLLGILNDIDYPQTNI